MSLNIPNLILFAYSCHSICCILIAPSGQPANIKISETSNNSLTFSWQPVPCADRGGENSYKFELRNSSDLVYSNETSELSVTINGLMPCIEYNFRIKAFNQAGDSDFSPPVKVTTIFPGKCLCI